MKGEGGWPSGASYPPLQPAANEPDLPARRGSPAYGVGSKKAAKGAADAAWNALSEREFAASNWDEPTQSRRRSRPSLAMGRA